MAGASVSGLAREGSSKSHLQLRLTREMLDGGEGVPARGGDLKKGGLAAETRERGVSWRRG